MTNLIERYIYDVTRRLPEKEREEVSKELKANIYDMLMDDTDENEIKAVLVMLGSPASLAEKYRQQPRYLISPAIYDDYIRAIKWILPLVGCILLVVGMILGSIEAIEDGMVDGAFLIRNMLSNGISLGVSAAVQALVWTTVGFAIAERVGVKTDDIKAKEWKVEDLPEPVHNTKARIPLSDSVIELILTVVFAVVAILACSGVLPIVFTFVDGDTKIVNFFNPAFLASCIPAIAAVAFLSVCECIVKIKERRWTPLVCGTVIISNLVSMVIWVIYINNPNLLSAEFTTFLQSKEWGSADLLRFAGTGGMNPVVAVISAVIIICSVAGCVSAVFKTVQFQNQRKIGG